MNALRNPSALLNALEDDSIEDYQALLYSAKQTKAEAARNKVYYHTRIAFLD